MVHHQWLVVVLLFSISIATISSDNNNYSLFHHLKGFLKSPLKWYRHGVIAKNENKDFADIAKQNRNDLVQYEKEISLEGSLVPIDESLEIPAFLRKSYEGRQGGGCSCNVPFGIYGYCETICTSSQVICGQTCSNTTFWCGQSLNDGIMDYVSIRSEITDVSCKVLGFQCSATEVARSASAAITVLGVVAAIVVGVGVGVGVGVPALVRNNNPISELTPQSELVEQIINQQQIPENDLEIPVGDSTFPDDGCGSSSVRFNEGNCIPLFSRESCPNSPFQWVTLNSTTVQGQCTPRLCGRERVFVGRDGLCHDIDDPSQCQGGRRLYYSAFGDSICDCPIGQYPFPTGEDNCVAPFTPGPCPAEMVVTISPQDTLVCAPSQCPSLNSPEGKPFQMVPFGNAGQCFALGTRGPCPASHLLGYDVFARTATCVNMEDPSSPYFSSPEEDEIIDRFYNQPEFNDVQAVPFPGNQLRKHDTRRQGSGVFQFPSRFPDSLLNPCRPGDRKGFNYKCANPLVPNLGIRDVQQPIRSPYRCQSNEFLQPTGQCSNDGRGANCGPSYRYNPNTGQCRPIFR